MHSFSDLLESVDFQEFVPQRPATRKAWARLSIDVLRQRYEEAERRYELVKRVAARVGLGESERGAVAALAPTTNRSTFLGWKRRLAALDLDGLIDARLPPLKAELPGEIRETICTLRRDNGERRVEDIVAHVAKHHAYTTSGTRVKRVLKDAGLSRSRGRSAQPREQRLELGGMKLVEAAEVESGLLAALTATVVELGRAAVEASEPLPVDTTDRDEYGRFRPEFNERFRKEDDDAVGPGFWSVEETRASIDPRRLHLTGARNEIVERKMNALLVSPLLGNGRWDGLRVPRGELLGELCGYPYMPDTLDLFTRELKQLGVAQSLWETYARVCFKETEAWGTAKEAAVLYVDGTSKGIWTNFFSQSTKVSTVGRVMPGLDVVAFHTGFGVPLWMATHSGRAPLVTHVPGLITRLEATLEGAQVGRILVMDAEANSVRFLKGLEEGTPSRAWVTRLRPSLVENKEIFDRTPYRDYRNGDRVRMGLVDLNDPDGGAFRVRVIELERRSKGTITYLGASTKLSAEEWKPPELADLYFERWPAQEANFRAVSQAVGFKEVHGYGKQLVENISVVTEIDRLKKRQEILEKRREEQAPALQLKMAETNEAMRTLGRLEQRSKTTKRRLNDRLATGGRITTKVQRLSAENEALADAILRQRETVARGATARETFSAKLDRTQKAIERDQAKLEEHAGREQILQHDVELDSIFGVLKVSLVLLVTIVLKKYFANAAMAPVTFLERVATLPARLRMTPSLEILTFEYNRRDSEVMTLLAQSCDGINALKLKMRSGRVLQIHVDPAPAPRLPPPRGRVNTQDRFHRS